MNASYVILAAWSAAAVGILVSMGVAMFYVDKGLEVSAATNLAGLSSGINAYTAGAAAKKAKLHTSGRAFLRKLAGDLGLSPGSFDIRSNKGGIAVFGEVTLHGERIYVQLSEWYATPGGVSVLYRSCSGQKDYSGGRNNSMRMRDVIINYPAFVAACKRLELEVDK